MRMIYFNTKTKKLYQLIATNVRYDDISSSQQEGDPDLFSKIDKNDPIVKSGKAFHVLRFVDLVDGNTEDAVMIVEATGSKAIKYVSTDPESKADPDFAVKVPLDLGSDFIAIKDPQSWTDEEIEKYDGDNPTELSAYDEIIAFSQTM